MAIAKILVSSRLFDIESRKPHIVINERVLQEEDKMAELTYRAESRPSIAASADWSAIWAGLFTFIAIWSVFTVLGFAIFGAASGVGLGIWSIVLATVAMFIAGRETGRLAGFAGRRDGALHGMVMFGLSVAAAAILTLSGGFLFRAFPGTLTSAHYPYILNAFAGSEWAAFIALFLGWIGAMAGASFSVEQKSQVTANVTNMRPAA